MWFCPLKFDSIRMTFLRRLRQEVVFSGNAHLSCKSTALLWRAINLSSTPWMAVINRVYANEHKAGWWGIEDSLKRPVTVCSWCLAMETCPSVDITTPASLMKIIGAINYSKYSWSGNETPVHHSPTCARLFCPTGHKRVSAVFSVSPSNLINQTKDAQFNKESHRHGIEAPLELGNT